MNTSLEAHELKRVLTVESSADDFKQKTDKILKKMASQANISGFRKGKVPVSIMRKKFSSDAEKEAVNEIVNETLTDALKKEELIPAGKPLITKTGLKDEHTFIYTVEFEVYPKIKVADFSKLEMTQIDTKITNKDEDKTLKSLIDQAIEYKVVERKSKDGDQITIDFKGLLEGKVFKGGTAKDFKMVLGKGSMISGFEEGLTDIQAGKCTTLDLTFPKDYHATQLAGKAVIFEIEVKEVAEPSAPKLDDLAKRFGEKDIDALKKNIKKQMEIEAENRLTHKNKDILFDALLQANEFVVPQISINVEAKNLLKQMQQRMQQQGVPVKDDMPASTFNAEAERRVRLGLLVNQISIDNKFEATKKQLDAQLEKITQQDSENAQQILDYYRADPSRMTSIELMVIEEMVQNLILKNAKISRQEKSFQEITQQAK